MAEKFIVQLADGRYYRGASGPGRKVRMPRHFAHNAKKLSRTNAELVASAEGGKVLPAPTGSTRIGT